MALNNYFKLHQNNINETDLISNLYAESVQIYGVDVKYLERESLNRDDILGEDILSSFSVSHTIEMYISDIEGFGGGDLITKFGLNIPDELNFEVNVNRWKEVTGLPIPKEGDLIYLPTADALMEIAFVEDEKPFYIGGKNYMFKIRTELFEFNREDFNTGDAAIDDINLNDLQGAVQDNEPGFDNEVIEVEANNLIDKSETDPFGGF